MKFSKTSLTITSFILCTLLWLSCIPSSADPGEISVYVNGTVLQTDTAPIIENGRTLVPLRAIAESIGLTVDWEERSQKITLGSPDDTVTLYVGDTTTYKNGTKLTLDVPPKIHNSRTLVPVRFVAECFGFRVDWLEATRKVLLTTIIPEEGALSVYVLDVGQADSIFVKFPDGSTMLVDGGNPEDAETIIGFLKSKNVNKLNFLVATHPHSDHIGGLPEIINKVGAEKIYMPGVSHNTDVYEETLLAIKNSGNKIITAKAGVTITSGFFNEMDFSAKIIAPCSSFYKELNDYSAVIMLSFGKRRILLTGDAETVSENQIPLDISADVLKVGHHGSDTSTGADFLKRVDPKFAVISVGRDNSYGLPDQSILDRLKKRGCSVFRTDEEGTIAIITNGKALTVGGVPAENSSHSSQQLEINGDMKVYIPKNGNKYHYRDCPGLNQSNYIREITLTEARTQKRVPCKICTPPN